MQALVAMGQPQVPKLALSAVVAASARLRLQEQETMLQALEAPQPALATPSLELATLLQALAALRQTLATPLQDLATMRRALTEH